MKENKSLGELIEKEVRKQQIPITKFADMIHCQRNNVYDIFKRNSIDVRQLARISEVLNHNFLNDIAKDMSILNLNDPEIKKDMDNKYAIAQFTEVVPAVLRKLGKNPTISFGCPKDLIGEIIPDFIITEYFITFTVGESLLERFQRNGIDNPAFLKHSLLTDKNGHNYYVWENLLTGWHCIDIKLDYKTEEEWEQTLKSIFDTFF